jgi:hypothetical protein
MLKWMLGCLLLFGLAASATYADTIGTMTLKTGYNWTAGGDLSTSGGSSGTWTLAFNFNNNTGNIVDINSFAVQLFNANSGESFAVNSATLNGALITGVSTSGWEYFADDKLNNGGTPDCSSNSVKGWLCADTGQGTLTPYMIGVGQSAMFVFSGTYANTSGIGSLDLMASGCVVAGTCQLDSKGLSPISNGNKWAVSGLMTTIPVSPVPEPASLALLASGLLMVGTLLKRR